MRTSKGGRNCHEEEAIFSGTNRRSAEAGRGRGADRGAGAASGDFRADILALEEAVREAGDVDQEVQGGTDGNRAVADRSADCERQAARPCSRVDFLGCSPAGSTLLVLTTSRAMAARKPLLQPVLAAGRAGLTSKLAVEILQSIGRANRFPHDTREYVEGQQLITGLL